MLDPQQPVADAIRPGDVITVGAAPAPRPRGQLLVQVVGGGAAGHTVSLQDALLIGRDERCDLCLPDGDVSRRHAVLEVCVGGIRVRDLGSTNGTWSDGRRVDRAPVTAESLLRLGDSYLRVAPSGAPAYVRAAEHTPDPIPLPSAPAPASPARTQWLTVLAPALGGIALAWAMHSTLFLLMAALTPLGAVAGAGGERWHWRRATRREATAHRAETASAQAAVARALREETRVRRAEAPDAVALAAIARDTGAWLWSRGRSDPSLLHIRVGLGAAPSRAQVSVHGRALPAGEVGDVPVLIDAALGPVALCGPSAFVADLARWWVLQLATYCPPADVRIVPLLGDLTGWECLPWLPSTDRPDRVDRTIGHLLRSVSERREHGWDGSWMVLLVDRAGAEDAELVELLRSGAEVGVTALLLDPPEGRLTSVTRTAVRAANETGARVQVSEGTAPVIADRVAARWAEDVARALAARASAGVPSDAAGLSELIGAYDRGAILARWSADTGSSAALIGRTAEGPVEVDLDRDGPHALVAGTTGAGKSELLRTWVAALAAAHPPTEVSFLLVDYKGGAAFGACERLPHVVGVVTDLDPTSVRRALASLGAELRRREGLLAAAGVSDWAAYRATRPAQPLPRLVLVLDEFAELAAELPQFISGLVSIARRGRSLGVHLILATQRPGGSVSPEIRANTALKIALRTTTVADSLDVIDSPLAAQIDAAEHGSGYLRRGRAITRFRAGYAGAPAYERDRIRAIPLKPWRRLPADEASADAPTDLDRIVASIGRAAQGLPPPRRPWLPPLPPAVARTALPPGRGAVPIGLVDLPEEQRQQACELDLATGGSVLIAGGARSGRTTALLTIAGAAVARYGPGELELYAVAPSRSALTELAVLPHAASCVDVGEIHAVERLLVLLEREIDLRREAPDRPLALLLIDGWDEFAAADEATGRSVGLLLGLIRAAAGGLTVVLSGDRTVLTPRVAGLFATRYILPLTDPADYALAGIASRATPNKAICGRAVRAGDGAEVQFAHLGTAPTHAQARGELTELAGRHPRGVVDAEWRPVRVRSLPRRVELAHLPPPTGGRLRIHLGVGGDAARPVSVALGTGARRLLIAGPPHSGRSTVLRTIAAQLDRVAPVVAAAPARSPLVTVARERGWRLLSPNDAPGDPPEPAIALVDDLEEFRDTASGERLTGWATAGVPVVAAARSADLAGDYRGLGALLRRAGCAVLLQPTPADGQLIGITLPRQGPADTPGRGVLVPDPAWLAEGESVEPMPLQVATP